MQKMLYLGLGLTRVQGRINVSKDRSANNQPATSWQFLPHKRNYTTWL